MVQRIATTWQKKLAVAIRSAFWYERQTVKTLLVWIDLTWLDLISVQECNLPDANDRVETIPLLNHWASHCNGKLVVMTSLCSEALWMALRLKLSGWSSCHQISCITFLSEASHLVWPNIFQKLSAAYSSRRTISVRSVGNLINHRLQLTQLRMLCSCVWSGQDAPRSASPTNCNDVAELSGLKSSAWMRLMCGQKTLLNIRSMYLSIYLYLYLCLYLYLYLSLSLYISTKSESGSWGVCSSEMTHAFRNSVCRLGSLPEVRHGTAQQFVSD